MKKYFFLILFVLLSYSAYAKTLAYNNWVYNNKGFSLDGKEYTILIPEGGESVLLKTGSVIRPIDLAECIEFEYKEFCMNSSSYVNEEEEYKAQIYVYYLVQEIDMALTSDETVVSVGDYVTFTGEIENAGDSDLQVAFNIDLPEELQITEVKNAEQERNIIHWDGIIKKGETNEIVFKIKVNSEIDKYLKASILYFDGVKDREIFSDAVRIYTDALTSLTLTSEKEEYEIGEEAVFSATFKNNGDETLRVDYLTFSFPGEVMLEDNGVKNRYTNEFTWSGSIEENNYKNITFSLFPEKQKTYLVSAFGKYTYLGKEYVIESKTKEIESENKNLLINTSLQTTTSLKTQEPLTIVVKATNKNSFVSIKKTWLNIKTEFANFENLSYGTIRPNETILLLNNELISPYVSSDKEYNLIFNVTYMLENDELYSEKIERKIKVIAEKKIEINPILSQSSVYEEEPVTVTLKLKNSGQEEIKDAQINVIIPKEFIIKGTTSDYVTLSANQEISLFTFTAYPPIVDKEKEFIINFTAKYEKDEKEHLVSSEKIIRVIPKKPKVSLSKTISESSIYQGQVTDIEYIVQNQDTIPIYDLILYPAESKEFDTLNKFNHTISKLNPGEKNTFRLEQVRGKKTGSFQLEKSILYFNDKIGRRFNVTSSAINIKVSESKVNGAMPYLVQEASSLSAKVGEEIILTINVSNIGSETLNGYLDEFGGVSISKDSYQSFQKRLKTEKEGILSIPRQALDYELFSSKAKAYSNPIEIKVINNTEKVKSEDIKKEDIPNKDEVLLNQEEKKTKKGFFASIFDWFIGLFKKV